MTDQEAEAGLLEWIASRPPAVRAVAERFRPWMIYQLKSTGQFVRIRSFDEPEDETQPVTVSVVVLAGVNWIEAFDYGVFGVNPDDLIATDKRL